MTRDNFLRGYDALVRALEGLHMLEGREVVLPPSATLPGHRIIGVDADENTVVLGWFCEWDEDGVRTLGRSLYLGVEPCLMTLDPNTIRIFRPHHRVREACENGRA